MTLPCSLGPGGNQVSRLKSIQSIHSLFLYSIRNQKFVSVFQYSFSFLLTLLHPIPSSHPSSSEWHSLQTDLLNCLEKFKKKFVILNPLAKNSFVTLCSAILQEC